jgi:hypothetical protein
MRREKYLKSLKSRRVLEGLAQLAERPD